jgi:hypothetical protein
MTQAHTSMRGAKRLNAGGTPRLPLGLPLKKV